MAWTKTISYLLWMFGGWLGLHHLYLGRDYHAMVWLFTFGGCFGMGWLRDLWRLPEYIRDSKFSEENELNFYKKVLKQKSPPFSITRYAGEQILGIGFAYLTLMAMPAEFVKEGIGKLLSIYLPPIATAIGVYLVGNIGREKVSFKWCIIGAYVSLPWLISDPTNVSAISFLCTMVIRWKGVSWRIHRKKQSVSVRLVKYIFFASLFYTTLLSAIYFNGSITTKDEETVYIRDAVNNFFKSPAWAETKETLFQLYHFAQTYGWKRLWQEFVETFDPVGENNAYKVLGLSATASQEEITSTYRKLSRKWHPDKQKDPSKKLESQEKFIEIQNAYEILSKLKSKRSAKNKNSEKS